MDPGNVERKFSKTTGSRREQKQKAESSSKKTKAGALENKDSSRGPPNTWKEQPGQAQADRVWTITVLPPLLDSIVKGRLRPAEEKCQQQRRTSQRWRPTSRRRIATNAEQSYPNQSWRPGPGFVDLLTMGSQPSSPESRPPSGGSMTFLGPTFHQILVISLMAAELQVYVRLQGIPSPLRNGAKYNLLSPSSYRGAGLLVARGVTAKGNDF